MLSNTLLFGYGNDLMTCFTLIHYIHSFPKDLWNTHYGTISVATKTLYKDSEEMTVDRPCSAINDSVDIKQMEMADVIIS